MLRLALTLAFASIAAAPARSQWSTDSLSVPRVGVTAVSVDGVALFAGGASAQSTPSDVVDIYHAASGTWTTATLSVARGYPSATVVGHLALIAGGIVSLVSASDRVDVFDAQSGTWSIASLSQPRAYLAAATVGNKALFAGGTSMTAQSNVVDIYDSSIGPPSNPAAWSTATLSQARMELAGVGVGTQALFAGGRNGGGTARYATVDIYDDSTGLWTTSVLSQARTLGSDAAVAHGTRAYFAGGSLLPTASSDVVDVYDAQTSSWSVLHLSVSRDLLSATAAGNRLMFAGGVTYAIGSSDRVDVLETNTGTWLPPMHLSQARSGLSATTVDGVALFGGGYDVLSGFSAVVDLYKFPPGTDVCQAGTGGVLACPCANPPANAPRGCDNSSATGGAQLTSSGTPSIALDSVVFTTNGERPSATSIVLQGTAVLPNGTQFGQGVRCVSGSLRRLYVKTASGGSILAPGPGDPSVSARSAALGDVIAPGSQRWYAVYYRDPVVLGGCPASSVFNVTQTQDVLWSN